MRNNGREVDAVTRRDTLEGAQGTREPFAAKVPISWNRLSGNALKVAIAIASFASTRPDKRGTCRVGRATIAERAFPGRPTSRGSLNAVSSALAELQAENVIVVRRTGKSSWYVLVDMVEIPEKLVHQIPEKLVHGSEPYILNRNSLTVIPNHTRRRRRENDNKEGAEEPTPSDALVIAVSRLRGNDDLRVAYANARTALLTLGEPYARSEMALLDRLTHPIPATIDNPIAFAIADIRSERSRTA